MAETADILADDFEDVPALDVTEYRALVQGILPPTDREIDDFVTFVMNAKSWYKHLPPFGPGVPISFFIDPRAGLDRVRLPGRRAEFFERTETSSRFHYTWMTTESYRRRFGYLSFCCQQGTMVFREVIVPNDDGTGIPGFLDNNPSHPIVYATPERPCRIPEAVLNAGSAQTTGVVHPIAATVWFWQLVFSVPTDDAIWPEASGGASTLVRLRERCLAAGDVSEMFGNTPDPEIETLVKPERERMRKEMVLAARRMRHLVFSGA